MAELNVSSGNLPMCHNMCEILSQSRLLYVVFFSLVVAVLIRLVEQF
jgi:hypothetical protein